jgi:hypothetical protein
MGPAFDFDNFKNIVRQYLSGQGDFEEDPIDTSNLRALGY